MMKSHFEKNGEKHWLSVLSYHVLKLFLSGCILGKQRDQRDFFLDFYISMALRAVGLNKLRTFSTGILLAQILIDVIILLRCDFEVLMRHIVATYVGGLDNYPDIKLYVESLWTDPVGG